MKPFILSCLMLGASALAAQATTYLDPSGWSWSASSTCSSEGSLDAIGSLTVEKLDWGAIFLIIRLVYVKFIL
jgi:hypothetical protein